MVLKVAILSVLNAVDSLSSMGKMNVTEYTGDDDTDRRLSLPAHSRTLLSTDEVKVTFSFTVILEDLGYSDDDGSTLLSDVSSELVAAVNSTDLETSILSEASSKGVSSLSSVSVDKKASRTAIDETGSVATQVSGERTGNFLREFGSLPAVFKTVPTAVHRLAGHCCGCTNN